jgi:hypothetical protein
MEALVYFISFWYILRPFGKLYGHLVNFTAIWYILRPLGAYIICNMFPVLVCFSKTNLATLLSCSFFATLAGAQKFTSLDRVTHTI